MATMEQRRKSDVQVTFKRQRLSDLGKASEFHGRSCTCSVGHSLTAAGVIATAGRLRRQRHAAGVGGAHAALSGGAAAAATQLPPTTCLPATLVGPAPRGLLLRHPRLGAAAGDDEPADHTGSLPRRLPGRPRRRFSAGMGPLYCASGGRGRPSGCHHAAAGSHAAHAVQRGDQAALAARAGGHGRGRGGGIVSMLLSMPSIVSAISKMQGVIPSSS